MHAVVEIGFGIVEPLKGRTHVLERCPTSEHLRIDPVELDLGIERPRSGLDVLQRRAIDDIHPIGEDERCDVRDIDAECIGNALRILDGTTCDTLQRFG
jgi:hypothetical protein